MNFHYYFQSALGDNLPHPKGPLSAIIPVLYLEILSRDVCGSSEGGEA